jgi:hypothetical protein
MLLNTVFLWSFLKTKAVYSKLPKQRSLAVDLFIWPELMGRASDSSAWLRAGKRKKSDSLHAYLQKLIGKAKGKVHPRTGHEGPEGEQMYSPTLPLTSALDGMGGLHHAPAALPPGKTRYPMYRRMGGPHWGPGRVQKISPSPGFDLRTVQAVAIRYTDWANPAHQLIGCLLHMCDK